MKTWFNIWPLLVVPFSMLIVAGFFPAVTVFELSFGGVDIRIFLFNLVLNLLPFSLAADFANWYLATSLASQLLMHVLLVFNISVFSLPVVFVGGNVFLRVHNALYKIKLKASHNAIK